MAFAPFISWQMLRFLLGIRQNPEKLPCEPRTSTPRRRDVSACARAQTLQNVTATAVTHITLSKATSSKPCLEYYSDGDGEPRRVKIEQCPFRIGRAESADLRIETVEVSREHAEICHRNGMWLVRDLGSTNGTHVNGKQIHEMLLSDGDILRVAETEFTFIDSAAAQFQRMVTQPIQSKRVSAAPLALPVEVAATRMVSEATLRQVLPTQLLAARSTRHQGTEALFAKTSTCSKTQPALESSSALGEHYLELARRRAVELAVKHSDVNRLYVAVGCAEIEAPHRLFSNLRQLKEQLPADWELGITISILAELDILRIADLISEAQDHDLRLSIDDFQGNGSQVTHFKALLPDYLILAASMTKDLTVSRQPLRRLESLLAVCNELAIKPVLPPMDCNHSLILCQDIGFELLMQSATRSAKSKDAKPATAVF
jgi:pSer/pThr/pTyr-binding forkhead associated (FHA) protein